MTDSIHKPLTDQTILIADSTSGALASSLHKSGARLIMWPQLVVRAPESWALLDEAIENLFGYDWLILRNLHAVDFFLRRFRDLQHEPSELDSLRVIAVGHVTNEKLSAAEVHVDVTVRQEKPGEVVTALERYLGGREFIAQKNFLNLRAAITRDMVSQALRERGARVDAVEAYRTIEDDSALNKLNALLHGAGIDCVVFLKATDCQQVTELFDTGDLSCVLKDTIIASIDKEVASAAARFGLETQLISKDNSVDALTTSIVEHFSGAHLKP